MRAIAFTFSCCLAATAFAQNDGVWVDVGNGCQANYSEKPKPEETYRWVGPCKDGRSEGLGYLTLVVQGDRYIWRQTDRNGYLEEPGTGYGRFNLAFWRARPGAKDWERIEAGKLPGWARTFLADLEFPPRPRQPEEAAAAAKQSSDAKLKATVEKTRITASSSASGADWIAIGPSYEIDAASLSVVMGRNGMLSVYERGRGSSQVRRLYVTCEPFSWGENQYGMRPVDHAVDYQVELVREVCRRTALASTRQITPAYANPPYQTLMNQGMHAEAFAAAKKAAESGNAVWVRTLAWHYWEGKGVAQDNAEAARLYRRAAEGGDALAMNQIGYALLHGRGTAPDPSAAIPWLKRSAELGNSSAMINLAWAYQGGRGTAQDLNTALHYANQAKTHNNRQADEFISSIQSQMSQQASYEQEQARELERIRRENEEDDRQARREARAEQEARDRQWTDMATSIMQGAAAMKRQQDEQNARRESERRRIEADNARYRQQRADEDRRWLEQNQRQQQAAVERQRAEQERQRVEQARREEERRRPREQRVNLPKYTGCIRLEWGRNIPANADQWYTLHNTCANNLNVHWCDRPGCQRAGSMALIRSGGNTRSWLIKKNGVSVTVVAACQVDNGGKTVFLDRDDNQCWSMVTMN